MVDIFIIDDSVLFRTKMTKAIEQYTKYKVVGTANDVMIAQKKINILDGFPAIIILDVELPKIDGLTFLKDFLSAMECKVIVCTSYYSKYKTKAFSLGAYDVIDKNLIKDKNVDILIDTLNKLNTKDNRKISNYTDKFLLKSKYNKNSNHIIAIGSSTGGLEVLDTILQSLPNTAPPILIVQHMGRDINGTFIPKMLKKSNIHIQEAIHDEPVKNGTVYIAPFNSHLSIKKKYDNKYYIVIQNTEKISYHRPSIDVLFNSFAIYVKSNAMAFILTGMGYDGVDGIKNIKQAGGKTFAQDEKSCTVFGMSKVAIESNMIDQVLTPQDIVKVISSI